MKKRKKKRMKSQKKDIMDKKLALTLLFGWEQGMLNPMGSKHLSKVQIHTNLILLTAKQIHE